MGKNILMEHYGGSVMYTIDNTLKIIAPPPPSNVNSAAIKALKII